MYQYLRTYPYDREMGWSEEANGVCHDEDNWFFTQNGNLWKFPITHRIQSTCKTPDVLIKKDNSITIYNSAKHIYKRETGGLHLGDIDHYNGYIFVPVSGDSSVYIYKASDLSFFRKQKIVREDKKPFNSLGWLAINPKNGLLYTSDNTIAQKTEGKNRSRIHIYKIDLRASAPLSLHSTARLFDEYGEVLERSDMQGGCFDDDNHLHISNGYYEGFDDDCKWHSSYANSRGGISVFKTSASPAKGGSEALYRLTCSSQKGEFRYQFNAQYVEPEGLTYWDLDKERRAYAVNDRKIEGQLHAIIIDNFGKGDDDFYFKHYRRNFNSRFYKVQLKTGNIDGAGSDADLYITFIGSRGSSREYYVGDSPRDDLERGNLDTFMVEIIENIGTLKQIFIRSDGKGKNSSWFLEYATVVDMEARRSYKFYCNSWFAKDKGDKKLYRLLNAQ